MKIKVKGYLTIKKAMGNKLSLHLEFERATVKEVLDAMCKKLGRDFSDVVSDKQTGELSEHIRVFVNGRHYSFMPKRMDTELKDGDELSIFPPVAGG